MSVSAHWPTIGSRVVRNPATWLASEFDGWGAGEGVGEVVEPPWSHEGGIFLGGGVTEADWVPCVDVRWPTGRAFQRVDELLSADDPANVPTPPMPDELLELGQAQGHLLVRRLWQALGDREDVAKVVSIVRGKICPVCWESDRPWHLCENQEENERLGPE